MFKLTLLIIIIIQSSFIYSQELDEAFIASLPKEMQDDVLKNIEDKEKSNESVYRGIQSETELEKLKLYDLKERLEKDLDILEEFLLDEEKNNETNALLMFGSDFFRTYQSTYMPVNEPNLNPSYILDVGDELEIQLIGSKNMIQSFLLKRDGSITLPEIGQVKLSGLSLSDASSYIKAKVRDSFIGTEAYISLINLRDVNILISGNAFNPGIYTLNGNSNILHAISVAGGINDKGSYREIDLIRDGKVVETLDMYDVLITGQYNTKKTLRTGDIIFVNPIKNIASIDGAVKNPAKYELFQNQNLSDLIGYANGVTKEADLKNIFLNRILDGKLESLPIRNLKQFNTILANDGDHIFIRKFAFRYVDIEGAVLKPGRYLMSEGETLSDLIKKSGGYTENAYPFGAIYENQTALKINEMAKEKLYNEFIDNIITVSQKNPTQNFNLSSIIDITENLANSKPNGRIVIDLLDKQSSDILVIRDGDKLKIPEKPNHVYIYGEVSYEGALKFSPSESVKYYINQSGGLKNNANSKAIYVLHPNGITQKISITKNLFQNTPNQDIVLHPGSIIFIPRKIDNSATSRLAAQAYVSILGNLGIALASLSSINNN